jgi:hypothetical protein
MEKRWIVRKWIICSFLIGIDVIGFPIIINHIARSVKKELNIIQRHSYENK